MATCGLGATALLLLRWRRASANRRTPTLGSFYGQPSLPEAPHRLPRVRHAGSALAVAAAKVCSRGRASAGRTACSAASQSCQVAPRSPAPTWRSNLAGKKKTTFAKLNREAKVREKRQARSIRKEQRRREAEAGGGDTQHEVEDLSHLDVPFVEGVEPDVTVKR